MPQQTPIRKLNCPTCGKQVLWNEDYPHRPFCSKRCQLIDFGDWAEEKHRIPDSNLEDDPETFPTSFTARDLE